METNYFFDSSDSSLSYHYHLGVPPPAPAPAPTTTTSIQNSFKHQLPTSSLHRSLHSVRKPVQPNKPWSSSGSRKPTSLLPPNPTRVYKVDRMKFRELVQMLTGTASSAAAAAAAAAVSDSQPRLLREVAPPPLDLTASALPEKSAESSAAAKVSSPLSALYRELISETLPDAKMASRHRGMTDASGTVSLGLGLSPSSSLPWSSVPLLSLSPGNFL
ncbi:hypothetical protein SAY87_005824 [Trapa incisa]|uniref:VQ domain-containing protein n=1 Tax=Trapa incisa TaxID=236973 RepID=A0AAN7K6I6_9MYRT|nr:hypothetical protein SAY87_005824 [Trapa incisa]